MVIDSGAHFTTATPVHEGYSLHKGILRFPIGGETITKDLSDYLFNDLKVNIRPRYSFNKKLINVNDEESFEVTPLGVEGITDSYRDYMVQAIVREIKEDNL